MSLSTDGFSVTKMACLLSTTMIVLASTSAHAQAAAQTAAPTAPAEDIGKDEVIVTATRQAQGAQKVPISLTAIGSETLASRNITSVDQINQLAPSVYVNPAVAEGSTRFSIRGISNNDTLPAASSAVATYIDDVYQAVLFGTSSALFDVQRIEVLRGPQGTTFGRNTTGGAVAYFSQLPKNEAEGYVTARLATGDRPQRFLEGVLNVPIVDEKLALRLSTRFDSKSAYRRDVTQDRQRGENDNQVGRLQLRWTPDTLTSVNLILSAARSRGDGPLIRGRTTVDNAFSFIAFPAQDYGRRNIGNTTGYRYYDNFDNRAATLRIEREFGGATLTSITHYRDTDFANASDLDGTAADLFYYTTASKTYQYGQELRLSTDAEKPLSGIAGLYYERDRVNELTTETATRGELNYFGVPVEYNGRARYITSTKAYAAFLNVTYKPIESLAFIGGIRKSREIRKQDARKDYFQPSPGNVFDWTPFNILTASPTPSDVLDYTNRIAVTPWTWDGTINYNPSRRFLAFARVAKGYRSGGFNPAPTQFFPRLFGESAPTVPPPFGPEQVQSYELGTKTTLRPGLRVNASIYHYDYTNQQVTGYVAGVPVTNNAGKSRVNGGEIELSADISKNLQFSGNVSYTDAKYKIFDNGATPPSVDDNDFGGNRLIQAPKWTALASLTYTAPISDGYRLNANTNWNYASEVFYQPSNSPIYRSSPTLFGAIRLALEPIDRNGVSVALFVNNITDRRPIVSAFTFGPGFDLFADGIGRSAGVDLSYRF